MIPMYPGKIQDGRRGEIKSFPYLHEYNQKFIKPFLRPKFQNPLKQHRTTWGTHACGFPVDLVGFGGSSWKNGFCYKCRSRITIAMWTKIFETIHILAESLQKMSTFCNTFGFPPNICFMYTDWPKLVSSLEQMQFAVICVTNHVNRLTGSGNIRKPRKRAIFGDISGRRGQSKQRVAYSESFCAAHLQHGKTSNCGNVSVGVGHMAVIFLFAG